MRRIPRVPTSGSRVALGRDDPVRPPALRSGSDRDTEQSPQCRGDLPGRVGDAPPGETDDAITRDREVGVTAAIGFEGMAGQVGLATVRLHDQPVLWPAEVDLVAGGRRVDNRAGDAVCFAEAEEARSSSLRVGGAEVRWPGGSGVSSVRGGIGVVNGCGEGGEVELAVDLGLVKNGPQVCPRIVGQIDDRAVQ